MSNYNFPVSGHSVKAYFPGNGRQYEVKVDHLLLSFSEDAELSSVCYAVIGCTDDCRWLTYFSHHDVFDLDDPPEHDGKTYLFNTKDEMCKYIWNNVIDTEGNTDSVALLALKSLGALRLRI